MGIHRASPLRPGSWWDNIYQWEESEPACPAHQSIQSHSWSGRWPCGWITVGGCQASWGQSRTSSERAIQNHVGWSPCWWWACELCHAGEQALWSESVRDSIMVSRCIHLHHTWHAIWSSTDAIVSDMCTLEVEKLGNCIRSNYAYPDQSHAWTQSNCYDLESTQFEYSHELLQIDRTQDAIRTSVCI